ncbi:MAG: hypothetical protein GWN84_10860 [Gammaproteobacteria bacterium]|nr:hypothetical protein [Gammaproteobacteria bacterium]NIR83365.1 hypothetical protein [Gammaproteobacteria bacterium]NIR91165.1 hypothetical protein [Gammaproteobacteria bacterium]NIU04532.1 hypothetical protein [Gammaproteobacteria bacterium]NIW87168.1 hypothetical protein [Gammaproteobacteria bacterium]
MRRRLLVALACLVAAVGLGLQLASDPGEVVITRGPWMVRMNLALFVLALGAALLLACAALRGVAVLWRAPARLRARSREA